MELLKSNASCKQHLTAPQLRILRLLKQYDEPAEAEELIKNATGYQVLNRLVTLALVRFNVEQCHYELTEFGDQALERGWIYTVPKM